MKYTDKLTSIKLLFLLLSLFTFHDYMSVTTHLCIYTFFSCQTVFIKLGIYGHNRSDFSLKMHDLH